MFSKFIKIRFVLVILLLVCCSRASWAGEWIAQNSGVLTRLMSVFFLDRQNGFIVGTNGLMLTTADGGEKWERKTIITREVLRDVQFLDPQRGFVLGEYSIFNRPDVPTNRSFLLSSADSGKVWKDASFQDEELKADDPKRYNGLGLTRLIFVDDRVGWACGEAGLMLVTRDSGKTWQRQMLPVSKLIFDVSGLDESNAWAVGGGGVILRTVDGGKNWNEQSAGVPKTLRGVHFIDGKRGWAVGSAGTILTTSNGGNRWQVQASGTEENLNAVYFTSKTEGWACGDRGVLLHTTDGGTTWERITIKSRSNLMRFFFVNATCGWVVGSNGAIFKYQAT